MVFRLLFFVLPLISTSPIHGEKLECMNIDMFNMTCIPGSPEMWVEEAHDGYTKWRQPPNPGMSCCNNTDCHPVQARYDEKRKIYQALIDGEWRDIPPEIILDPRKPENENPDGGYHACWDTNGKLLCFRVAEPKI